MSEIVVVFRTFPIRVAGNQAGPLKNEITWEQLRKESGYPHPIEERTSVTDKVRRVARFDWDAALSAINMNRPTQLAVNGLDYLDYRNLGATNLGQLSPKAKGFLDDLNERTSVPVNFLGVGPSLQQIIAHGTSRRAFELGMLGRVAR